MLWPCDACGKTQLKVLLLLVFGLSFLNYNSDRFIEISKKCLLYVIDCN